MLGLVTIGQSPRPDVSSSMFNEPVSHRLLEAGALDALPFASIRELAPTEGDHPLVTRLRNGSEVVVAKHALLPHLQRAVDRVTAAGAGIVCILCTGEFPRLETSARLVFPDRLLFHTVEALLPVGRLGVLMPHAGQRESMIEKWTTAQRSVVTSVASPYAQTSTIGEAADILEDAGAELIVMDCMGFDRQMQATVRQHVSASVLLANGVVGALLNELAGSRELTHVTGGVQTAD